MKDLTPLFNIEHPLFAADVMRTIALRFSQEIDEETERRLWGDRQTVLALLRTTDEQRTRWFFTGNSSLFLCLRKTLNVNAHEATLRRLGPRVGKWVASFLLFLMVSWAKVRFQPISIQ